MTAPVGTLLQHWRRQRRMSQLVLAGEAGVTQRHVSFVESGRASPSREMVLALARALDVPLRERNQMLLAAGYAPHYRETGLDADAMAAVRAALERVLAQQEPYPAVVMDRHWDITQANGAAQRMFAFLLGGPAPEPANVVQLMFTALRAHVANFEQAGEALVARVHREAVGGSLTRERSRCSTRCSPSRGSRSAGGRPTSRRSRRPCCPCASPRMAST